MGEAKILYGKKIADEVLKGVKEKVADLHERNIHPLLMTLEIGEDAASRVYLGSQRRTAERVGIQYETIQLSDGTSQKRLFSVMNNINRDPLINGLILHVPLPPHLETKQVQWYIDTRKDVEGVTPYNLGRLFLGVPGLMPCTAQAIVTMIKSTKVDIRGKEAVVIGQSDIVGKPCAMMLLQEEATVTICHLATDEAGYLEEHVRRAEIVVVAAGKPGLIKGEWIRPGAIVIDAGITAVGDHIVGDVEFEAAKQQAAYITPVPGGVGAVTVAYLMKNTVDAVMWQTSEGE
ncbi:MAG: bifunctional 5,10-methylenetetrahydrofolate dehydrogenase/5,10-methenyltetrahydrofolate cyclohydrolase [Syntrophomonadaceae bacterium]|nr:bifunctional 5,10-methylenetetrahydrofolate dehydrogenase/5,10-methenyltetrahydrofolate cyclohydrolase [Syntrophomonadaceae bacterium]